MKINMRKTDRGFLLGEFEDHYKNPCSIQESSLADEDCIWLGTSEGKIHSRMHLTQDMAVELIRHLQTFVDTGRLTRLK